MRLVVPPTQFSLPNGICWGFAQLEANGSVCVIITPPEPASAAVGAGAHLDAIRREIERRARDALAAERGQA